MSTFLDPVIVVTFQLLLVGGAPLLPFSFANLQLFLSSFKLHTLKDNRISFMEVMFLEHSIASETLFHFLRAF